MKYQHRVIRVRCIQCGHEQEVWNYLVSKLRCSCGGRKKSNWLLVDIQAKSDKPSRVGSGK